MVYSYLYDNIIGMDNSCLLKAIFVNAVSNPKDSYPVETWNLHCKYEL